MEDSNDRERQGRAVVTSSGIVFAGRLYTCSLAIKEMWYEKARHSGEWEVQVDVRGPEMNGIHIVTPDLEPHAEHLVCRQIDGPPSVHPELSGYYEQLQQIKAHLAARKHGK
ncbi:hypothetical protein [Paenibacillus thalictri]|uniref:Uncharacterized protein n=1 Tax=Paenibacillus thalictri TaxID=2527873 RepID=A0A4Q9DTW6_9BACL|nr:hypothetical protein [Paenibacillus thalictri]TBL80358.1 hypothetical protein EYB31_08050 [Paenibacillus thalictri]